MHRLPLALFFLLVLGAARLSAGPLEFSSVVTTFHAGTDEDLRAAIDGVDVGPHGWFVAPRTGEPQTAVFRVRAPVEAETVDVTLCFLSGQPNSFFAEFALSLTRDPEPSFDSRWEPVVPVRLASTGPAVTLREDGRLAASGSAADAVFQFSAPAAGAPVTGFRVDAFPSRRLKGQENLQFSVRPDGDFMLTEFRAEAQTPRTTNVAWNRPVKASHALWGALVAGALTDGLPGTFAHPRQPDLGAAFFFEIDLGAVRTLDHIRLRNRGDSAVPERLSRMTVELFDEPPGASRGPAWKGVDRADGSHPGVGESDVLRAGDGAGRFSGRWLRISSDSPVAFSPQLAEVEAYEELGLQLAALRADGAPLPTAAPLRVPPGARWLRASLQLPRSGLAEAAPCRWRLRGYHADWQTASNLTAEGPCPPPGAYVFEAQVRHTDGEWDSATLQIPIEVRAHFWRTRAFRIALAALLAAGFAVLVRGLTARRLARRMRMLEAHSALDAERARIARDMHDEVGARLAQLAVLHDIFACEHPLPEAARENLRQLARTARQAVASLDEVVWAVNPKNDTLPSLAAYLEQCATGYLAPVEIACRLDAPLEWPALEVRAQVRHNLVLAFREALQNVLKHSGATEVVLRLRLEASRFVVQLADNGRGFAGEPGGDGKDGLDNMRARLASVGGTCEVRPGPSGGVEAELCIPLAREPGDAHL